MKIKMMLFSFVLLFASIKLQAQLTFHAHYTFMEVYPTLDEPRQYKVSILKNKDYTLYTSLVAPSQREKENVANYQVFFNDHDFKYKLFMTKDKFYTHDYLQGQEYYFEENAPEIIYEFTDETKMFWNKTAHKATTHFRGRDYVIWYEKNDMYISPWKFVGIPGVVFEAYSTDNIFRWNLERIDSEMKKIESPFPENTEFLSYEEYPEKTYDLTEKPNKQSSINPNNAMIEQERHALEIEFEWEN